MLASLMASAAAARARSDPEWRRAAHQMAVDTTPAAPSPTRPPPLEARPGAGHTSSTSTSCGPGTCVCSSGGAPWPPPGRRSGSTSSGPSHNKLPWPSHWQRRLNAQSLILLASRRTSQGNHARHGASEVIRRDTGLDSTSRVTSAFISRSGPQVAFGIAVSACHWKGCCKGHA